MPGVMLEVRPIAAAEADAESAEVIIGFQSGELPVAITAPELVVSGLGQIVAINAAGVAASEIMVRELTEAAQAPADGRAVITAPTDRGVSFGDGLGTATAFAGMQNRKTGS